MITLCKDSNEFLNVTEKLQEVKGARLTQNILYNYMISGLYNKQVFTYVSYDKERMNGCLVLLNIKDLIGEKTLALLFIWIDAHYPNLLKEFIDIANEKAKELQVKKISFITNRKEKVINKRMCKFEFYKTCSIFEKIIEKEMI